MKRRGLSWRKRRKPKKKRRRKRGERKKVERKLLRKSKKTLPSQKSQSLQQSVSLKRKLE